MRRGWGDAEGCPVISRAAHGFQRTGVVLATPPLLLAIWFAEREAWLQWSSRDALAGAKDIPLFSDLLPAPRIADFTLALLLFGLAVALYAGARATGWVLDGFMSTSKS